MASTSRLFATIPSWSLQARSRWAARRETELVDEPWIVQPPGSWVYGRFEEAFKKKELACPHPALIT